MKYLIGILLIIMTMNTENIFNFSPNADIQKWQIVDDVVMGGRSSGNLELTPAGHGKFTGTISLENNGGFSSLRYPFSPIDVHPEDQIQLRIKGDGKIYQFRVKHDRQYRYSYMFEIETTGQWQTVEIPLQDMQPVFRGRNMDLPDFDKSTLEEVTFLIGNKKEESFELLIDSIELIVDK